MFCGLWLLSEVYLTLLINRTEDYCLFLFDRDISIILPNNSERQNVCYYEYRRDFLSGCKVILKIRLIR